ncbi:MAG: DHA2 family efflux MFS transporter permease subunit [Psittacicella sp.]
MNKNISSLEPLKGLTLVLVTIALALATFMQVLDGTIANVAIPTISGSLGISDDNGTWIVTSFSVANAISIPLTGWLAKRIGEVRLFFLATIAFVIFSMLCGFSTSIDMLILFRILQGFAAGPVIPLSQSLLLNNYPPEKRSMAMAFWVMTVIIAPVVGPILGGYITTNYYWGWIFNINLVFGVIVILIGWPLLKNRETKIEVKPIDVFGLIFLAVGVGFLQIMLSSGQDDSWFQSNLIIAYTIISIIGIVLLLIWELTSDHPVIDFSLFKYRNFTLGTILTSIVFLIYYGTVIIFPLVLEEALGYTSLWTGYALAPIGILPVFLSPLIAILIKKVDARLVIVFSFLVFTLTFWWRAVTLTSDSSFLVIILPQFVQGLALSTFFIPLSMISLDGIPPERMAEATGLFNFMRTLASAIGVAIFTFLWYRLSDIIHSDLVKNVNSHNHIYSAYSSVLKAFGFSTSQGLYYFNVEATYQSLIVANNDMSFLSGAVILGLIVVVFFIKKHKY